MPNDQKATLISRRSDDLKEDINARLGDIKHILNQNLSLGDLAYILDSLDDLVDGYSHILPQ